jgi:signal transduction histidine kinase
MNFASLDIFIDVTGYDRWCSGRCDAGTTTAGEDGGYGHSVGLERLAATLRRIPPFAVDVALAAAVAVANAFAIAAEQESGAKDPDALAYVLGCAIAAPLLVRRRRPLGVLLASALLLLAYHGLDYPAIGLAVPLAVAMFTAVTAGYLWATVVLALGLELSAIGFRALEEGESLVSVVGTGTVGDVALVAAVVLLAETLRTRRAWVAEAAERRVEQERMRIARELHDVLAHTVSVIGIQADVASEALPDSRDEARAALETIRTQSREALGELRATVGLLRDDAPRSPAPGLAHLDELVGMASGSKVRVETSVVGTPRSLPAIVELTAYRIVQESLTNVLRHADASLATVSIGYEPDAVVVEVTDDGHGANGAPSEGYGLAGMRERAAACGGRLEAGSAPSGHGFRVRAWLPTWRET